MSQSQPQQQQQQNIELEEVKQQPQKHIEWGEDHVNILVEWADKALCYQWLHSKAHSAYYVSNTWFTIPVIIMSTVAGTANFAQDKFPESIRQYATMGIGAINLFSGILTTIQQYLKISELNEAHRVASIGWDKFYRNTKVELAKSPNERIPVQQMMKHCKEEFDRLMETSPSIDEYIIKEFMDTFSNTYNIANDNGKGRTQNNIKMPEICNNLETTRMSVFIPSASASANAAGGAAANQARNSVTGNDIQDAIKKMDLKTKQKQINQVIERFNKEKMRNPLAHEIMTELDNKIELDIIQSFLLYNAKQSKKNKKEMSSSKHLSIDIMSADEDDIEGALPL
jgi:hypothetical protein